MSVPRTITPVDPDFEARVRASFGRQGLMGTLGARLVGISPGEVEIEAPFAQGLTQQQGFVHAGVITAIADSACGYAALTVAPSGVEVLTVEYKVNFLAPARGERFVARGRVIRAGRTVTVCSADVFAHADGLEKQVAVMLATIVTTSIPNP